MINKKAFTLVELIAVIIIIGIILGILIPTSITIINNAKENSFREGMRSIIRSAELYMEEEELKELPKNGIRLEDGKLSLDFADGYKGVIKYVDGEIVLENINNGSFCGNGTKDKLSIKKYVEGECSSFSEPADSACYIMGTTENEGDTIVGYKYDDPECDASNLVIPATVNGKDVEYIAPFAFNDEIEDALVFIFYLHSIDSATQILDKYSNLKYYNETLGLENYVIMPINNEAREAFGNKKICGSFSNSEVSTIVDIDYVINDSDYYDYCSIGTEPASQSDVYDSSTPFDEGLFFGINSRLKNVDFSNAINLKEIGDAAFYNTSLQTVTFGGNESIERIGVQAFSNASFMDDPMNYIIGPVYDNYYDLFVSNVVGFTDRNNDLLYVEAKPFGILGDTIDFSNMTNLKQIGTSAFSLNHIENVIFTNTPKLNKVGATAFYQNQISSLTLPNSISVLGVASFMDNAFTYNYDTRFAENVDINNTSLLNDEMRLRLAGLFDAQK